MPRIKMELLNREQNVRNSLQGQHPLLNHLILQIYSKEDG